MGSVVKEKDGKTKDNTREVRSRRMRGEVVGCFQAMMGKKDILVKL